MILAALLLAQAAPACTAPDAALPADFAHWTEAPADTLMPDGAPVSVIAAPPAPDAAAARSGNAATLRFTVARPGRYRLALDQKGWIDVRVDGDATLLESVDHGHGPACSSVAKFVAFDLQPGRYRLDLSGLAGTQAKVMLISAP